MTARAANDVDRLASAVKRAREQAGLSGRAFARHAGVSQSTLWRLEAGHDVDWTSATRVLQALPGLDVAAALGVESDRVKRSRAATRASWEAITAVLGVTAQALRARIDVDDEGRVRRTLRVEGLTAGGGDGENPAVRLALLGGVLVGDAEVLRRFELSTVPLNETTEHATRTGTHCVHARTEADAVLLDYERVEDWTPGDRASRPSGAGPLGAFDRDGCLVEVDLPVETLQLSARFPPESAPALARPWAWPLGLGLDSELPHDWWADLYPLAPRRLRPGPSGEIDLAIEFPRPGLAFGLTWGARALEGGDGPHQGGERRLDQPGGVSPRDDSTAAATSPCRVRPQPPRSFAETLRSARRAGRLSRRALARRLDCSPATVLRLEAGAEPTVSQVRAGLECLPTLAAADLPLGDEEDLSPTRWWRDVADLLGVQSTEELRRVTVSAKGTLRVESTSVDLTWRGTADASLRVRYGLTRALQEPDRWELESVTVRRSGEREPRLTVLRHGPGLPVHDLCLLKEHEGRALTIVRRLRTRPTDDEGGDGGEGSPSWRIGPREPFRRFFYVAPGYPTRQLRFEARLPRHLWPVRVSARAQPRAFIPVDCGLDVLPHLGPDHARLAVDDEARCVSLVVERPVVGVRYAVVIEGGALTGDG